MNDLHFELVVQSLFQNPHESSFPSQDSTRLQSTLRALPSRRLFTRPTPERRCNGSSLINASKRTKFYTPRDPSTINLKAQTGDS